MVSSSGVNSVFVRNDFPKLQNERTNELVSKLQFIYFPADNNPNVDVSQWEVTSKRAECQAGNTKPRGNPWPLGKLSLILEFSEKSRLRNSAAKRDHELLSLRQNLTHTGDDDYETSIASGEIEDHRTGPYRQRSPIINNDRKRL